MRRFGLILAVLALASLSLLNVPAASAGSFSFSGTLVPGGPALPVVALISTPNCTGGVNVYSVLYASRTFTVDTDGVYTFTEPGTESALYLYGGSFDPTNPAANCLAASNSNPLSFSYPLTVGTTYIVVVIEDTFTQDGMSYDVSISGPGAICPDGNCAVVDLGGCDLATQIPAGSVVGQFVTYAPVYWKPGELTSPVITVEPGMTYMVAGQDESGQFRKVLIACSWVWVESDTIGPNPQSPWNGMPLPTTVVQ